MERGNGCSPGIQFFVVSALIIAKWDGEAKAGVVCTLAKECPVPVRFVGVGEKVADLAPFSVEDFVTRLS